MRKFGFTCQNCNEQFNVDFEYMLKKESLVCPNCSNSLPEESFSHVKSIATALEEYGKAEMGRDNEFKHFVLTIQ